MENVKYIPGDLVKIYGNICRVKGVRKKDNSLTPCLIEAKVISDTENIVRAVDINSIEPLPLTPAILEANGWKTQDGSYYFLGVTKDNISYIGIDFKYPTKDNKLYVELNDSDIIKIEFVHELQHLLFGLGLDSNLKI